jgi:hypothetical protein
MNQVAHGLSPSENQTILKQFDYDGGGRLTDMRQRINGEAETMIFNTTYNELDQPIQKDLGRYDDSHFLQSLHYGYTIRGWLKHINFINDLGTTNELFAEELGYNEPMGGSGSQDDPNPESFSNIPQYNGNISCALWGTLHGGTRNAYSYTYDHLSRITGARFAERADNGSFNYTDKYTESGISYDCNGNLLSVNRHGYFPQTQTYGIIDSLTYLYGSKSVPFTGNKLKAVVDLQAIGSWYDFYDVPQS